MDLQIMFESDGEGNIFSVNSSCEGFILQQQSVTWPLEVFSLLQVTYKISNLATSENKCC